MATQDRDEDGRFGEKMRDQDVLKAFDFETTDDDPYLTVSEVADALAEHWDVEVTNEAVRTRLERMRDDETVEKRRFGPGVGYRAAVAPRLAEDVAEAVAKTDDEPTTGETTSHDDLWERLDE
jgi:hypothetical protein